MPNETDDQTATGLPWSALERVPGSYRMSEPTDRLVGTRSAEITLKRGRRPGSVDAVFLAALELAVDIDALAAKVTEIEGRRWPADVQRKRRKSDA